MAAPNQSGAGDKRHDPSLGRVVIDDLRHARLDHTFAREFKDLYHFYIDNETRARLAEMGRVKRAFWLLGWLLKSLTLKLSPARRLLLLPALFLGLVGRVQIGTVETNVSPWGFVLLLLILMLELKDKLLARDEINVARQVQLALFPQERPVFDGWSIWSYTRPANDVGGDLVDYVEFGPARLGVALGDVAGKGLGAALLTAKLQATLRAVVPDCNSLDDLGARLNTILYRDGLDNRYATLFYLELEPDDGRVRFVNAGHNPAVVLGPERSELLGASALPLGMMPATTYAEGNVDLRVGDMLLAYSDGLTEAQNPAGEEFGMERLERLLPGLHGLAPDDAGHRILDEIDRFLGGQRAGDDLSLVIVLRE